MSHLDDEPDYEPVGRHTFKRKNQPNDPDRRSIGRTFNPTYQPGRDVKKSRMEINNQKSADALKAINEKYSKKNTKPISRLVDANLRIHSTII